HCVLAWDARGHGSCRPVIGSITLARLACDLAEMLDHFGLERPVLVGHSMGALTLMQYLHSYGTERVAAVALIDQSPRIVTAAAWVRRQLSIETALGRMLRKRLGRIDVRPLLDLAESMAQADFRDSLSR